MTKFHILIPLLLEILSNMCIVIGCFPGCDVINVEINLIFRIKLLFYMTEKSKQKLEYLENEKSFWSEVKSIFHHFYRVSVAKNCPRPEGALLTMGKRHKFCPFFWKNGLFNQKLHILKIIMQFMICSFSARFSEGHINFIENHLIFETNHIHAVFYKMNQAVFTILTSNRGFFKHFVIPPFLCSKLSL